MDLQFSHLGKSEGLENNNFNSFVFKDSRGFVWISSMQGCYRFDGQYVKHYIISKDGQFGEMVQSSFFEDKNENLWFTTYDALHCYNRKSDDFKSVRLLKDSAYVDHDYHAFHFNTENSILWLNAGNYIWGFNTKDKKYHPAFQNDLGKRFRVDCDSSGKTNKVFAFPWMMETGFNIWNKKGESWEKEYFGKGIFRTAEISNGLIENDSIIWLISNEGLIEFDYIRKQTKQVFSPTLNKNFTLNDGVFIEKNLMLLSYKGNGLWSFDTQERRFIKNWKSSEKEKYSLSIGSPAELYLDHNDKIWITQLDGLDHAKVVFKNYKNPLKNLSGSNRAIKNIIEDGQSRVWILDTQNGIYIFDLNYNLITHIKEVEGYFDFSKAQLSIDKNEEIWLKIKNNIFRFNDFNNKRTTWDLLIQGNENQKFYSLFHGANNKPILVDQRGVFEVVKDNQGVGLLRLENFKRYSNFEFRYLFEINENTIFAPFQGQDVFVYKYRDNLLSIEDTIKINAETFDIIESKFDSSIWLATSKGLMKIDRKGKRLIIEKNALEENCSIYSIIEANNKLWLSTDCGIWFYDLKSNSILKYSQTNELPSSIFSHGVGLLASNGTIWFDNESGLTVFHPDSIKIPVPSGSVFINNFWVNNKEDKRIFSADKNNKLHLKYTENKLDFEFGIIGIDNPSNARIQYRLKNHDDEWLKIKNGGVVHFPNLASNHYQLEIIPIDAYNQKGGLKIIDIVIAPPFWKTLWFRAGGLFLFAFLIALMVRLYYQAKIREQEKLLEKQRTINTERDRIAKELHDDMGGELSSILFISEDMYLQEKDETKKEQTERISALTKDALNNMKDIIWALDNQQNTLEDLILRIKSYSTNIFSDHQIHLDFQSDIQTKEAIILGSEKKRNTLLIVKECLHNIIKHAEADKVIISIKEKNKELKIVIRDNGKGFDLTKEKSKGHGLNNMIYRCKITTGKINIDSSDKEGTSIVINTPLEQ